MSTNHNLSEEKGELKRNQVEALLLTSLTPYRWAKQAHYGHLGPSFYFAVTLQTTSGTAIAQTAVLTFDTTRFHPNYLTPTGPHIITLGSLSCTQVNTHSDDREKELCKSQVAFRGCKATLNREKE